MFGLGMRERRVLGLLEGLIYSGIQPVGEQRICMRVCIFHVIIHFNIQ